ncbi:polysaccharide deacetylase family protein [Marinobacter sp. DUT-1]|uniref:polysaccharide deacetylase family protein n=1 Tax=Marinobacter sp. DUT-1 TaxID=3412037 RepID=UPI003D184D2F
MTFLKQATYRLAQRFGGLKFTKFLSRHHPKILMYHRITDLPDNEGIPIELFQQHVDLIREEFEPMTLSELLTRKERSTIPENAVVVTFDDGYADFADKAFPILAAAKVPATLFVTTGFVNGDIWLWPDQIRYLITHTSVPELKLSAISETFDLMSSRTEVWNVVANYCLTVSNEKKIKIIDEMSRRLEVPLPQKAPEGYEAASWTQIKKMVTQGLDVGSHSISHPILTKLSNNQLVMELQNSKKKLELETGKLINIFCYPNGTVYDFDENVKRLLEEVGYQYGVSAYPSRIPLEDNWCINRYPVGKNIDVFKKNLYGLTYLAMKS